MARAELRDVAGLAPDILPAPPVADARQGRVRRRPGLMRRIRAPPRRRWRRRGCPTGRRCRCRPCPPAPGSGPSPAAARTPRPHPRHGSRRWPPSAPRPAAGGLRPRRRAPGRRPSGRRTGREEAVEVLPGGEGLPAEDQGEGDEHRRRERIHRRVGAGGEPRDGGGGGEVGTARARRRPMRARGAPCHASRWGGAAGGSRSGRALWDMGADTRPRRACGAPTGRAPWDGTIGAGRRPRTPAHRRKPTDRSPHAAAAMPRTGRRSNFE